MALVYSVTSWSALLGDRGFPLGFVLVGGFLAAIVNAVIGAVVLLLMIGLLNKATWCSPAARRKKWHPRELWLGRRHRSLHIKAALEILSETSAAALPSLVYVGTDGAE
jgi:hypothetical protein